MAGTDVERKERSEEEIGSLPLGIVVLGKEGETHLRIMANVRGELNAVAASEAETAQILSGLGESARLELPAIELAKLEIYQVGLGGVSVTSTGGSIDRPGRLALHVRGRNMLTGEVMGEVPQIIDEATLRSLFIEAGEDRADFCQIIKVGYDTDYGFMVWSNNASGGLERCRVFFLRPPLEQVGAQAVTGYDSDTGLRAFLEVIYRGMMMPEALGRPISEQVELAHELDPLAVVIDEGDHLTSTKIDILHFIAAISCQLAVRAVVLAECEGEELARCKGLLRQWSRKFGRGGLRLALSQFQERSSWQVSSGMWGKLLWQKPEEAVAPARELPLPSKTEQSIDALMGVEKIEFESHLIAYLGELMAEMNNLNLSELNERGRQLMKSRFRSWDYLANRIKLYEERFKIASEPHIAYDQMPSYPYIYEHKILNQTPMEVILPFLARGSDVTTFSGFVDTQLRWLNNNVCEYRRRTNDASSEATLGRMRNIVMYEYEGYLEAKPIVPAVEQLISSIIGSKIGSTYDHFDAVVIADFVLQAKVIYALVVEYEEARSRAFKSFSLEDWLGRVRVAANSLVVAEKKFQ